MLTITAAAIDPAFARNITVYHVNPRGEGPIPLNMDTADVVGDLFFDMVSVIVYPLACPNGTATPHDVAHTCSNVEAFSSDLVVSQLILEVDIRFSAYGALARG
jgi:hypothetical protein